MNSVTNIREPLALHKMNFLAFSKKLYDKGVRFSDGRKVGEIMTADGPKFIGLSDGQKQVLASPARFKVLAAGRRFGKSKLCALMATAALLEPNRRIWVVGPEYIHVEKIFREVYKILVNDLQMFKKNQEGVILRNTKGDYVISLPNGSVLEGKSASNPDSMAGDPLDLIIFDEAALASNLDFVWDQILRPTLADNIGSAIFISSPRGKNEFYKLFKLGELGKRQSSGLAKIQKYDNGEDNDLRDWSCWTFPSYSNPFISREEYDKAKKTALIKGKYEVFKQEWDADFNAVTDVSFPEFKAFITEENEQGVRVEKPYHVQDYRFSPSYGPWFAACDFNIARPASTVYIQVDASNNVIIFDELFRNNTTAYIQAEFILEKVRELSIPYAQVIGDVSGSFNSAIGMTEFTQMAAVLGHEPIGLRQGRETGNHLLHEWLAYPLIDKFGNLVMDDNGQPKCYPKLFIASHCVETITALESAKRKMGRDNSPKADYDEFKTGHEGLLDAIRYALVYLFGEKSAGMKVIKGVS